MSWAICSQALEVHLAAMPGLPPTAWPNTPFTATTALHLRVSMLPSDSWAPYGSYALRRFKGIYQISVYAPAGAGTAALLAMVDQVCARFDRQTISRGGQTIATGTPVPAPPIQEDAWIHVPVSIPFETR